MSMFNCWYDTAGSESDKNKKRLTLVTAGATASSEKWVKFDRAWMAVLKEFEVTELHMNLFAHSEGQYEHFRDDKPKRAEFLARLTAVAKRGINKAFVIAMPLTDYDAVNADYAVSEEIGSPYAVTQALGVAQVMQWLHAKKGGHHHAQFFVEEGDSGQGKFMDGAEEFIGWKPIPLPRIEPNSGEAYTPFQICDFIAYEHRLTYNRYLEDDQTRELRKSFLNLRRSVPIEVGVMDESAIRAWCDDVGISLRKRQ